ncbi:MAG: M3 family metallopeptidase [Legionella sp.]|nr:M3 family metallopeptidase [Legionella sp.]
MSVASLPQFSKLELNSYVERLDNLLSDNLARIDRLLTQSQFSWDNLMYPLEDMDDAIERFWSPMSHLHAVVNSKALRECYQACLPKLSAYEAAIGHNQALYDAINSLDTTQLNSVQQKIVADALQDFELSGVALSEEKKHRFEAIQTRLSDLSNQFENNILDAGQAFSLHLVDEEKLSGLPEHALTTARELAKEKDLPGWVLNLEFPCYLAVVTYADDRALRETFYEAYVTRASDQGPHAGQYDNTAIINEMLSLRHEKAQLLGFANYAELSIATKMADSTSQVIDFLTDLSHRGLGQAQADINNLREFAASQYGLNSLEPWDIAYLSEKMRQQHYSISQEDLRPFFPQDKVMSGLFTIIERLYGIKLEIVNDVDIWHPDVLCYRLIDEKQQVRGFVYIDLFARQNKRGGAWMDSCQSRRRLSDTSVQLPVATLTCNFAKPALNKMAVLSHDEVLTLFHEFGHCLHHLLTRVDYLSASGINGVEWDAVELPSQIFENWCWEESALQLLTSHVETGQALPQDLYEKLLASKNFQSAMAMMRQLEFSLFDFRVHQEFNADNPNLVTNILNDVRRETSVVPKTPYNRFQNSFSHIFAGGYGAGYYSYKWAEVLSSDAYARFEDEGIFNPQTGRDFLRCVLEVGGGKKAADAFVAFRSRPACVDALLRHNGIGK